VQSPADTQLDRNRDDRAINRGSRSRALLAEQSDRGIGFRLVDQEPLGLLAVADLERELLADRKLRDRFDRREIERDRRLRTELADRRTGEALTNATRWLVTWSSP
jgi:hypothetical protein